MARKILEINNKYISPYKECPQEIKVFFKQTNRAQMAAEEATEKIRNLVDDLRSHGVSINADEMNFPKSYQVIIKIER